MREYLQPKQPRSEITLDDPGLVVWVNAINAKTGSNVDCQGIRVEFVNQQGDLFGEETSSWGGFGNHFWRVGHIFKSFPRDEATLTMQITTWKSVRGTNNSSSRVEFANPAVTAPARWTGNPLPQQQKIGELEIALTSLELRTNGGRKKYWETPATFWQPPLGNSPRWRSGRRLERTGMIAEDPFGNRGQQLGVHQPVLRYTATYYPLATNAEAAVLIGTLPKVAPNLLTNGIIWNVETHFETNHILAIGCFPAGMHTFSEGAYVGQSATGRLGMGATSGGAPSGWAGMGQRVSPVKLVMWHGHYTPSPVIYLKVPESGSTDRFAVRVKDEQGQFWVLTPEPEGASDGIMPYLVSLPVGVTNVVPEIVLLKPIRATFSVTTNPELQK